MFLTFFFYFYFPLFFFLLLCLKSKWHDCQGSIPLEIATSDAALRKVSFTWELVNMSNYHFPTDYLSFPWTEHALEIAVIVWTTCKKDLQFLRHKCMRLHPCACRHQNHSQTHRHSSPGGRLCRPREEKKYGCQIMQNLSPSKWQKR